MKKSLLQIINHYGVNNQLKKFTEEYFELVEAILNAENYTPDSKDKLFKINCNIARFKEHIAEEIADCYVMLEQFCMYYGISEEEITKVMKYKVVRQLERIENE